MCYFRNGATLLLLVVIIGYLLIAESLVLRTFFDAVHIATGGALQLHIYYKGGQQRQRHHHASSAPPLDREARSNVTDSKGIFSASLDLIWLTWWPGMAVYSSGDTYNQLAA